MNPSHQHSTLPLAVAALALFSVLPHCRGQATMQITFEGPPPQAPGTLSTIGQYVESGMRFWNPYGPENLTLIGAGVSWAADNGTPHLYVSAGGSLAFKFTNGTPFGLLSFDVAEHGLSDPESPGSIRLISYVHGGGTLTNDITLDGIIDGPGGLPDFQTISFDSPFAALDRVEIRTGGFSLDNVLLMIPEPGPARLFLSCVVLVLALRVHKSRPVLWTPHRS